MQLEPGKRLGIYEIIRPIGAGGMGEVYRARDSRIERDVAIKVLPAAMDSSERLRRFEQEARAAGSLNHPNLVTIHDFGTEDGRPFLVMELLEGETLRERLRGGRLTPRKAIDYATQIVRGLAAAHEKGIVHRDLKPENIFVTDSGRLKVLDFGLAKFTAPFPGDRDAPTQEVRDVTTPGTVLGTVGYMAPEQVRGLEADARSDIFSFGAILYEMLTGRRAFARGSAVETMNAVLTDEPPELSTSGIAVPPAVGRIVDKCIEKNPHERFRSAHDIALVLDSLSASPTEERAAVATGPLRKRRHALLIVPLLFAAFGAAITWMAMSSRTTGIGDVFCTRLTQQSGMDMFPALTPDGKMLVFSSNRSGNYDLYLQRVDGRNAINLTKDSLSDDSQAAFSPDGTMIAFRSEREGGGIFIMGATGESTRRLSDFGFNPSWSSDGKQIVVSTEPVLYTPGIRDTVAEIRLIDVSSGESRTIPVDGVQPVISPDGSRIAYWRLSEAGQRDIWTVGVDGTGARALTNDAALDWNPIWSPDGRYLYFGSNRGGTMGLWRTALDSRSGQSRRDPEPVPLPVEFAAHFTISGDGSRIAFAGIQQTNRIARHALDPTQAATTFESDDVFRASIPIQAFGISPDGELIAVTNRGVQEDVYVVPVDGSELRQVTNDAARDRGPSWSVDGSEIYFYSDRGGTRFEAWKIRPDGSGLTQLTRTRAETPWYPRPSPDGSRLLFYNQVGSFIIDVRTPGAVPRQIPNPDREHRIVSAAWSPDGRWIAGELARGADSGRGIVIYSPAEDRLRVIADAGAAPEWLPDGRVVYQQGATLRIADPENGSDREVRLDRGDEALGEEIEKFHLSRNGRSLFILHARAESDIWLASISN